MKSRVMVVRHPDGSYTDEELWAPILGEDEVDLRSAGGPGSGNFGHAGRPGEVGGSAPTSTDIDEESRQALSYAMTESAKAILTTREPDYEDRHQVDPKLDLNATSPIMFSRDARGMVKQQIVEDLSPKLREEDAVFNQAAQVGSALSAVGDDAAQDHLMQEAAQLLVQERLDSWAETSGDSDPRAISMQRAVAEEFGLRAAALEHFRVSTRKETTELSDEFAFDKAYSRAEYENTQDYFKRLGIKEVTVFRGQVGGGVEESYANGDEVTVRMQPASSWTTDLFTAATFAGIHPDVESPEVHGRIIAVKVPVERILSTAVTGRGCLVEGEVLLLGGEITAKAFHSKAGVEQALTEREVAKLKTKLRTGWAFLTGKKRIVINIDEDIANADWPKRTSDEVSSLRTAAASVQPETQLHKAADSQLGKVLVAVEYAFARGRRAVNFQSLETAHEDAARAVQEALEQVLAGSLLPVVTVGGVTGAQLLGQKFRTSAAFRTATKKKRKNVLTFSMVFNASNPKAVEWAEEHAVELAKNLAKTTKQTVRSAVVKALETGDAREAFGTILDAVGNRARAEMIAHTEIMRAVHEGQRLAWEQAVDEELLSGKERRVWIDTEGSCELCAAVAGTTAPLDGQYPGDGGDGPPLHPRCRCTEGISEL